MSSFDTFNQPLQSLAASNLNRLAPFQPTIRIGDDWGMERHTPMVKCDTPWDSRDQLYIEVPEYTWASVPGDPNNGSPFYYGRALNQAELNKWTLRYPSLEPPAWKETSGNVLALDNPLQGGYVQRFRVIPHDRLLEIRFGITNNSEKPLENLRCQLCAMPHAVESLKERWPTSSKMFAAGKVISWDAAGQPLSWLDEFHDKATGRFSQSCFFLAGCGAPTESRPTDRKDLMWLAKDLDVPAIAKVSGGDGTGHSLIVYSPSADTAFYNSLVPCFHADPQMRRIDPGETRWTVTYYVFYAGDLIKFFEKLTVLHGVLKTQLGILDSPHN